MPLLVTETVKEVRRLAVDSSVGAVTVEISEAIFNAKSGSTIVFYTQSSPEACGFGFVPARDYVIESAPAAAGEAHDLLWRGVPVGGQIVHRCGRTAELNTSDGQKKLAEVRLAAQQSGSR